MADEILPTERESLAKLADDLARACGIKGAELNKVGRGHPVGDLEPFVIVEMLNPRLRIWIEARKLFGIQRCLGRLDPSRVTPMGTWPTGDAPACTPAVAVRLTA